MNYFRRCIYVLIVLQKLRGMVSQQIKPGGCNDCANRQASCETRVVTNGLGFDDELSQFTCDFKNPLVTTVATGNNNDLIDDGFVKASFYDSTSACNADTDKRLYGFILSLGKCLAGADVAVDGNFWNFKLVLIDATSSTYSLKKLRYNDQFCSTQSLPPIVIHKSLSLGDDKCECDCKEGLKATFSHHLSFPNWFSNDVNKLQEVTFT